MAETGSPGAGVPTEGVGAEGRSGEAKSILQELNDSPYYQLLGIQVVEMANGYARLVMPVRPHLFQLYGVVHGGAVASLADSAAAVALISTSAAEEKAFTLEMKLNFLAPTSEGVLTAEARLFHRGRTIAAGDVEVRNGQGRLVAKGIATFMPVR